MCLLKKKLKLINNQGIKNKYSQNKEHLPTEENKVN